MKMMNKVMMYGLVVLFSTNAVAKTRFDFTSSFFSRFKMIKQQEVVSQKDLGTSKDKFQFFSSNFKEAVDESVPSYNEKTLSRYLKRVYRESLKENSTLAITDYESLQRLFRLPLKRVSSKVSYVESDQRTKNGPLFSYGVNSQTGELFLQKNVDQVTSLPIDSAEKLVSIISRTHSGILNRIGVRSQDLLFKETGIMAIRAQSKKGDIGKTVADSFVTYGLRKYRGLMVEESFVKVYSKNTKVFEGVDLNWPDLQFHPAMKKFEIKSKKDLMAEILSKITKSQRRKSTINVRMAVVLRPVQIPKGRKLVFVPSVKVGVYSKSGEAGNLFYVDLSKKGFDYVQEDQLEQVKES